MPTTAQSQGRTVAPPAITDRTRRFGYFPSLFQAKMGARKCGRQELDECLPLNTLVTFDNAVMVAGVYDQDEQNLNTQAPKEFTAKWFIDNVKTRFTESGFVEVDPLTLMSDEDAEMVFNSLHQPLGTSRLTDPANPTYVCRLSECASCRVLALDAAKQPVRTEVIDGEVVEDAADRIRENTRLRLLQASVTLLDFYRARWASLLTERGDRIASGGHNPGLVRFGPGETHIRLVLHANDPETENANAAKVMADQQAAANMAGMKVIADSLKQGSGGGGEALSQLAEAQLEANRLQAETNRLLALSLAGKTEPKRRRGPNKPKTDPKENADV